MEGRSASRETPLMAEAAGGAKPEIGSSYSLGAATALEASGRSRNRCSGSRRRTRRHRARRSARRRTARSASTASGSCSRCRRPAQPAPRRRACRPAASARNSPSDCAMATRLALNRSMLSIEELAQRHLVLRIGVLRLFLAVDDVEAAADRDDLLVGWRVVAEAGSCPAAARKNVPSMRWPWVSICRNRPDHGLDGRVVRR